MIKNITKYTLTAAILLCFGSLFSQNGATAEFKFSSTNGQGMSGSMKASFSEFGHKMEMNMANPHIPGGISMTTLGNKKNPDVYYNLNEKTKTYSEIKRQEPSQNKNTLDNDRKYTVKKIGEETVNGYKCVHFTVTSDKEVSEMWTTKAIAEYMKYKETEKMNKRAYSFNRNKAIEDAGCDGFPVKTIRKSAGGDKEGDVTMELVKFEKRSFSESDFSVPVGYTKSESVTPGMGPQINSQEIMKMTPEERAKYIEEMKKKYGK